MGRATSRPKGTRGVALASAWIAVAAWIAFAGLSPVRGAGAAVLYESATMGAPGRTGGVSVGAQLVGARFHLDTTAIVASVGGHVGRSTGTLFAAIVALGGAFPAGAPLAGGEVMASAVFAPDSPSSDVTVPLAVTLAPGSYALVLGSSLFGASGTGYMPADNGDVAGASYFFWNVAGGRWVDETNGRMRFTVDGETCALCPTPQGTWTPPPQAPTPAPTAATPGTPAATPIQATAPPSSAATPAPSTATGAAPTATAPAATPSAADTPAPTVGSPGSDAPTATSIPPSTGGGATPNGAPTSAGGGATPNGGTPIPSPGTELPLLRKPARKCQSAIAAQARAFGHALHAGLQRCFDRILKDSADGKGTLAAVRDCTTTLDPANPASKMSRRRARALAQIGRRCAGVAPGEVSAPCDPSASTIDATATCIIASYTSHIADEIADTYRDACMLIMTADLPDALPGMCTDGE